MDSTMTSITLLIMSFSNQESTYTTSASMVNTKVYTPYSELLQPYFRNTSIGVDLYGFDKEVIYDSNADRVYNSMYTDFMKP
jgi:hypothetical protein